MHFDLLTWPGYLCYTGDMGSFLFTRLDDMFQCFRGTRQNLDYWQQKVVAADRDGTEEYSPDLFRNRIKERFDEFVDDMEITERDALWQKVENLVRYHSHHGVAIAYDAASKFEYKKHLVFPDFWEVDCNEYTPRFKWCCHAIQWGIARYDHARKICSTTKTYQLPANRIAGI